MLTCGAHLRLICLGTQIRNWLILTASVLRSLAGRGTGVCGGGCARRRMDLLPRVKTKQFLLGGTASDSTYYAATPHALPPNEGFC